MWVPGAVRYYFLLLQKQEYILQRDWSCLQKPPPWCERTFSLRAHSTRGVAPSQALFRGVLLEDICVVAGWSSPHTFVRFYSLDVDTAPGSQILSVWTDRMLIGSLLDQLGSVFSLACLVYRSQSVKLTQRKWTYDRECLRVTRIIL